MTFVPQSPPSTSSQLKSPSMYYYNPEIPDSQGLGVDGRIAGEEQGWAEPLSPIASIHPTLTRFHSRERDLLPSTNSNNKIKHDAIPNSWAYLDGSATNQTTTTPSSSFKGKFKSSFNQTKFFLGFNDDRDLLNHMDVSLDEIVRMKTCSPLSLSE